MSVHSAFKRMESRELALCELCNRACRLRAIKRLFIVVSRLGNGVFWYLLIILLPFRYGKDALQASLHMCFVGMIGVVLYKYLKSHLARQRPYILHGGITLGAAPLDLYSFPSGHSLHAVTFTVVCLSYYPHLAWLLVPFASLVAMSRVILGLHYPSDVFAGALIGALLAWGSFMVLP
jgi:undecaprenyl-diphosphatase